MPKACPREGGGQRGVWKSDYEGAWVYRSGEPDPPLSLRDISPPQSGGRGKMGVSLRGNDGVSERGERTLGNPVCWGCAAMRLELFGGRPPWTDLAAVWPPFRIR